MPTTTPNYGLVKPGQDEFYNVEVPNANMDSIDLILKTLQDAISSGASEQELEVLRQALASHKADDVRHITAAERTGWNAKANLTSPTFAGTPAAPTPATTDNSTKIATTAYVRNNIGTLSGLSTTAKTNIVAAINELFTNVSDGKILIGTAITDVDGSLVVPINPTFQDLVDLISNINTGLVYASGNISSIVGRGMQLVTGLDFIPSTIILKYKMGSGYPIDYMSTDQLDRWTGSINYLSVETRPTDNKFTIKNSSSQIASNVDWLAF